MRQFLTVLFVLGAASFAWADGPLINGKHYLEDHPPQYFPLEAKNDSPFRAAWDRLAANPARSVVASLLGPIGTLAPRPSSRTSKDANSRMEQLLRESEDLRQARLEMQRFWLNNQPSVQTYERLNPKMAPKPRKP